jgi:hypothetical protein
MSETRIRGIFCPTCRGVRLVVYRTRRPRMGLVRRYRECSACGLRLVTEEQAGRVIRPGREKSGATSVPSG